MLHFLVKKMFTAHVFNSKRWRLCYCSHRGLVWNWQSAGLWG